MQKTLAGSHNSDTCLPLVGKTQSNDVQIAEWQERDCQSIEGMTSSKKQLRLQHACFRKPRSVSRYQVKCNALFTPKFDAWNFFHCLHNSHRLPVQAAKCACVTQIILVIPACSRPLSRNTSNPVPHSMHVNDFCSGIQKIVQPLDVLVQRVHTANAA